MGNPDVVVKAARESIQAPSVAGRSVTRNDGVESFQKFIFNRASNSMAFTIEMKMPGAGLVPGAPSVAVGRWLYSCVGAAQSEGSPDLGESSNWVRSDGVGFPAFGPPTPLYWLMGAVTAEDDQGKLSGVISRVKSLEVVDLVDRDAVNESWEISGMGIGHGPLSGVDYETSVDPTGRIGIVILTYPNGVTASYQYHYLDQAVTIDPPEVSQDFDVRSLFARIGKPEFLPPSLRTQD